MGSGRIAGSATRATLLALVAFAFAAHASPMTEREKIDALIHVIEAHPELKFIRLGTVHSSSEAAQMLRTKLRFAGWRVRTADEFIEHVATATQSGSPYLVVYPDGRQVTSAAFLQAELERISKNPAPISQ